MSRAFVEISFTEAVRAAQTRYGSREGNAGFERTADRRDVLGEIERDFIRARDGFYQASVGDNGWPYVQFRGGPPGFLQVLDKRRLAYADYRGNRQYISVGNLSADGRIALILMDYAQRRRLKIWGVATLVDRGAPDWPAALEADLADPAVERVVVIDVKAYDWNCPKHITPRFTEAQIQQRLAALHEEIRRLTSENRGFRERLGLEEGTS